MVVVVVDESVQQRLELGQGGWLWLLVGEPLLHGLLESFDFAAGAGVAGSGVLLGDVQAALFCFEGGDASFAAGEADGEHHAVVGEGGGGDAVGVVAGPELGQDDGSGDADVAGDAQRVAGGVVEPGQDFDVLAGGQPVVGEVGLPGFVGHGGFEAQVAGLGSLLGLGGDQARSGQVAADRGRRDGDVVVLGQVPGDGVGSSVGALLDQAVTQGDDQLDHGLVQSSW